MSPSQAAPLLVMIGLPGSGKSTWAARFVSHSPGYRMIATDDVRAQLYGDAAVQGEWMSIWRVVLQQLQASYRAIAQGQAAGVIYDATNVRRRHRREFIQAAQGLGFQPLTGIWVDTPLAVCLARNLRRSRQVPPEIIAKMSRQLTAAPPTVAEGLDRVNRVRFT
ncbi:MAG: AAA family ATPase [Phormidesmis sp.]